MILSIESSCDDSSIAITRIATKELIFHQKISQDAQHSPYGGVVPEIASRLHAITLPQVLQECQDFLPHLKAIAVTHTPGLSITLLEGVMMAKTLSVTLKLPLIGVHHLRGHVYSLFIEQESSFPLDVLLVSGGHTLIINAQESHMDIIAQSLDDSFGESFDKVAKMLGLGYPGGPIVERYAKEGDTNRFHFTVPLTHHKGIAFSFSGLKNSVRLCIQSLKATQNTLNHQDMADICAAFQQTAITHLLQQCERFLKTHPQDSTKDFGIVGGASANLALREQLVPLLDRYNRQLKTADLQFCSDNAAMIGRAAIAQYLCKDFTSPQLLTISPRTQASF